MTYELTLARGTSGVFLTTTEAGNTGDGGDVPWTVVSPSNASTIQYYNTTPNPITEETVVRFASSTGTAYEVRKTRTAAIRGAWQLIFRLYALPGSITTCGSMRSTAGGNLEMRISSGNAVALNANGTTFDTAATALNTSSTYVWDSWTQMGTTTSNGQAKHKLRTIGSDGSFTAVHTGALFTDKNTGVQGTNNIDSYRAGKITTASTMGLDLIGMAWDDGATDYCPDPKTGICASDQTVEPWTTANLVAVGLGSWTQLSGSAVSLAGSGKTRSYTAPVPSGVSSVPLVFGFGGDSVTNTILPATEFLKVGGVLTPVRLRTGASLRADGVI